MRQRIKKESGLMSNKVWDKISYAQAETARRRKTAYLQEQERERQTKETLAWWEKNLSKTVDKQLDKKFPDETA